MKKCNVFRGTLVLLTSVTLLSGCAKTEKENRNKDLEECQHLIVDFGNQPVIFRECEGYVIGTKGTLKGGMIKYVIRYNDKTLTEGLTPDFHLYDFNHNQNQIDEIEQKAIDKGAYVYKLQK